jgi:hypothetical protein
VCTGEAWALSGAKLTSSWQQQQQQQQQNQQPYGSGASAIPGGQNQQQRGEPTTLSSTIGNSRTDAAVDHNNMAGELPLSPEDLSSDV